MPSGKPAGVRCIHLSNDYRCQLFGRSDRPDVCVNFQALAETCGNSRQQAMEILVALERLTS